MNKKLINIGMVAIIIIGTGSANATMRIATWTAKIGIISGGGNNKLTNYNNGNVLEFSYMYDDAATSFEEYDKLTEKTKTTKINDSKHINNYDNVKITMPAGIKKLITTADDRYILKHSMHYGTRSNKDIPDIGFMFMNNGLRMELYYYKSRRPSESKGKISYYHNNIPNIFFLYNVTFKSQPVPSKSH